MSSREPARSSSSVLQGARRLQRHAPQQRAFRGPRTVFTGSHVFVQLAKVSYQQLPLVKAPASSPPVVSGWCSKGVL